MYRTLDRLLICFLLPIALGCAVVDRIWTENKYTARRMAEDFRIEWANFLDLWRGEKA